jgi:hypothetical protein
MLAISYVVVFASGVFVTKNWWPNIQTKTVEVAKEVVHNDVRTIIKTVKLPSGETQTTTETIDHTQRTDTSSKTAQQTSQPNWLAGVSIATDFQHLQPLYGITVDRRLLGPLFVGATLNTAHEVGINLKLEF